MNTHLFLIQKMSILTEKEERIGIGSRQVNSCILATVGFGLANMTWEPFLSLASIIISEYVFLPIFIWGRRAHTALSHIYFIPFLLLSLITTRSSLFLLFHARLLFILYQCSAMAHLFLFTFIPKIHHSSSVVWHPKDWGKASIYLLLLCVLTYELPSLLT